MKHKRKDTDIVSTKVTQLGGGIIGCRCFVDDKLLCEIRVKNKTEISTAIKDMLRIVDKLGIKSAMAFASRHRTNHTPPNNNRFIWY